MYFKANQNAPILIRMGSSSVFRKLYTPMAMLQLLQEIVVHPTVAFRRLAERCVLDEAVTFYFTAVLFKYSFPVLLGKSFSPLLQAFANPLLGAPWILL